MSRSAQKRQPHGIEIAHLLRQDAVVLPETIESGRDASRLREAKFTRFQLHKSDQDETAGVSALMPLRASLRNERRTAADPSQKAAG